nr:hypothetical protein [Tanacetum cinerariifolium]
VWAGAADSGQPFARRRGCGRRSGPWLVGTGDRPDRDRGRDLPARLDDLAGRRPARGAGHCGRQHHWQQPVQPAGRAGHHVADRLRAANPQLRMPEAQQPRADGADQRQPDHLHQTRADRQSATFAQRLQRQRAADTHQSQRQCHLCEVTARSVEPFRQADAEVREWRRGDNADDQGVGQDAFADAPRVRLDHRAVDRENHGG